MSRRRHVMRFRLASLLLLFAAAYAALWADQMRESQVTVAGAKVRFVLHPSAAEPVVALEDVRGGNIPDVGGVRSFVRATYDYKDGWKLGRDGSVKVIGTLMHRGPKHPVPFDDFDRVIPFIKSLGAEGDYTKVQRDGRTWLKRVGGSPATAERGSRLLEWRVALSADLLILFRVELEDFTAFSGKPARWRGAALQLQDRIFESLRVE